LTPHPPIIVPEVGRGREREAALTLSGFGRLTERLANRRPDVLLLLSPHQPWAAGSLFLNGAPRPSGSLAPFNAPDVAFQLETPMEKLKHLAEHLTANGVPVRCGKGNPDLTRDQGALVPLYFLEREWKSLPPVILASPIGLDPGMALNLGKILTSFDDGTSWALLASGDLSHRLTRDAPAGYSPVGGKFDAAVVAALSSTDPQPLFDLTPNETEDAGECGLRSVMTMLGLCRALKDFCENEGAIEVLSYEGPFGVGYCNALCG
jgi:aromatic ring-opening dioxygenase LigB subunit